MEKPEPDKHDEDTVRAIESSLVLLCRDKPAEFEEAVRRIRHRGGVKKRKKDIGLRK